MITLYVLTLKLICNLWSLLPLISISNQFISPTSFNSLKTSTCYSVSRKLLQFKCMEMISVSSIKLLFTIYLPVQNCLPVCVYCTIGDWGVSMFQCQLSSDKHIMFPSPTLAALVVINHVQYAFLRNFLSVNGRTFGTRTEYSILLKSVSNKG